MPAERTLQTGIPDITAIQQERAVLSREITQIHQEIFSKKRVPLGQRTGEYWNKIKGDPERLELGIATAIDAGRNPSAKMSPADAQTALHNMVSEKLPRFMNALRNDERPIYCTRVASVLVASSINPNLPMSPATFTVVDSMISQLDPESRVTTAMAISTRANYFMQRLPMQEIKIPMGKESTITTKRKTPPRPETADYVKKMDKLLQDTGEKLAADTENGNFSPQNLRTAIASLGFAHAEITTHIASSPSVKDLQAKAAKYLYDFVEHFTAYPSGYQDALMIAILAISEATPQTQYELLSLLTHNHRVTYNNRQSTSLDSFLRTALTADSEDLDGIFFSLFTLSSSYQEANGGITQLENLLIQQFVSVDQITPQEQMMLIKRFLSFSTTYGINVASEHITEEELIGLFYGKLVLYYPEHTPGSPIYLIPNIENGISEFGRVVGEITGQETQDEDKQQDEEDQPDATPTPPIVDFIGEVYPLFETQLQQTLKKIGIKANLPDHVIEAYDISLTEIGNDLPKEHLCRTRTLATKGNNVTFEENPIKSDENNFPRVYVKHDEPRRINGVLSSDIFGTLYLTPNQQVDFFLDKNGYPQGDIDKLYDEGLVSWPQIWQIKYRVTSTIHKLLIASQEELSQKHDSLANRANREIGSDKGVRGNSAGRLAEKVRESQKYFDDAYLEWSMQPSDNEGQQKDGTFLSNELDKIDEAACQRAIEEMDKTGQKTKTLWRQLDAAGMELARKEAHSKGYRVKKDPKNGYPMFMKSGRRQSIQAIDNAIENGVGLHKVIEITTNEAGLHDIVVSRSTFVSERTPVIQENAA